MKSTKMADLFLPSQPTPLFSTLLCTLLAIIPSFPSSDYFICNFSLLWYIKYKGRGNDNEGSPHHRKVTLILNQILLRGNDRKYKGNHKENLDTDLPEACSVCHMITEVGLNYLIQLYDSLNIVTILVRFIDKWKTE